MVVGGGSPVRRGWDAIRLFFYSTYLYLERLTRPVVERGGQPVFAPTPDATTGGTDARVIIYHYIEGLSNGTYFLAELLITRPLSLLGKGLYLALRAAIVFLYYLAQHVGWDGRGRGVREWTILRDLPNMHIDREYVWAVARSPSMGLRDYRRWRRRRGVRWAKPKVRQHGGHPGEWADPDEAYRQERRNWETARRRGGPFLGQPDPFAYVSDDEGKWEGKKEGKKEEDTVAETEHRDQGDEETGDAKGQVTIGRKEAKKGAKKRKHKR